MVVLGWYLRSTLYNNGGGVSIFFFFFFFFFFTAMTTGFASLLYIFLLAGSNIEDDLLGLMDSTS